MELINRSFMVLELLRDNPGGISIKDISNELNLPQSSVHRLLATLRKNGYVKQDEDTNKYKLSVKIVSLAIGYLDNSSLVKIARPNLQELSDKYNDVVFLSEFENDKTICVDVIGNKEGIQFYVKIGSEMPLNCSSAPQAIISDLEDTEIDRIIRNAKFNKFTSKTLVTPEDIKEKLKLVRSESYALCYDEFENGVMGVSASIKNKDGDPIAAVTMLWIDSEDKNIDDRISSIKKAAKDISRIFGYEG